MSPTLPPEHQTGHPPVDNAGVGEAAHNLKGDALVVHVSDVHLAYGKTQALNGVSLDIPPGQMLGLIGPDGVGKSSLMALISGVQVIQEGTVEVLGGDMRDKKHRDTVCIRIAYMPQGLGKNLYSTLTVEENLQFFARLFGQDDQERRERIDSLTRSTGLYPFLNRPAGKLSGGMKQKLGLCCALIHDPDLLILDEPTTGVDPLARSQFWELITQVRAEQGGMSVLVATAYMDEAQNFDWLAAMNGGTILASGSPQELMDETKTDSLEQAFIQLLPEEERQGYKPVEITPLESDNGDIAIKAENLTKRFGNFTAVEAVNFEIRKGEIFGFLGSNGSGKTTTMKMLTGLLPPTEGKVWLFGKEVNAGDMETRRRLGYMTQSFSLYSELSVRQNLVLHARLFSIPEEEVDKRVEEMIERFSLQGVADKLPDNMPLGLRQRLSLAVAVIHKPELLILDEPTSGVDPVARDDFWRMLIDLSRKDKVTIFITTHFMNEAERCDRISLMDSGKVLDSDTPKALMEKRHAASLEEAFIDYLKEAEKNKQNNSQEQGDTGKSKDAPILNKKEAGNTTPKSANGKTENPPPALISAKNKREDTVTDTTHQKQDQHPPAFSLRRLYSCMWRESLELARDPIRATLALLGSLILMLVTSYGISMDIEDLTFAVLDRDQTMLSRNYVLSLSGSRYFVEREPLVGYEDLEDRMRSGEITLALEIPPNFGRDVDRGEPVQLGVWIDGAMPQRAETIRGYVQGMHQIWLVQQAEARGQVSPSLATIEIRYRYNPDVKSMPAMVPAIFPLLLLMLPAILSALAVVREKELGSIINFYTTPLTKTEFLVGKQIPYVVLAMLSFVLMVIMAVTLFQVPVKGSFLTLVLAVFFYCIISTGFGLLMSTFMKSQIAALFVTMIATLIPSLQYAGLLNPVASLEGGGRIIGTVFPATYMLIVSRGVFNKALGLGDLYWAVGILALTAPLILILSILLLKKQEQ